MQRKQRFNLMILAGLVLIVIFILRLMKEFDDTLDQVTVESQQRSARVSVIIEVIGSHLGMLQTAAQSAFYVQDDALPVVLQQDSKGQGYYIRKHSHAPTGWEFGNMLGPGSLDELSDMVRLEQAAILSITPLLRTTRNNIPYIENVYYRSESGFSYLYPWVPGVHAKLQQQNEIKQAYEQTRSSAVSRRVFWSAVYSVSNRELISVGSPVYFEGQFRGLIGLDFDLTKLSDELNVHKSSIESLWLSNFHGQLLDIQRQLAKVEGEQAMRIRDDLLNTERADRLTGFSWGWGKRIEMSPHGSYMLMVAKKKDVYLHLVNQLWLEAVFGLVLFVGIGLLLHSYQLRRELKFSESHDRLTGMYNRTRMMNQLQGMLQSAEQHNMPLFVALVQFEGLPSINQIYGHLIGDEVLEKFSVRLTERLGKDRVCRWGGERFLFYADSRKALDIGLAHVADACKEPIHCYEEPFQLQYCVGVARFPEDANSVSALVNAATQALAACDAKTRVAWYSKNAKTGARPDGTSPGSQTSSG